MPSVDVCSRVVSFFVDARVMGLVGTQKCDNGDMCVSLTFTFVLCVSLSFSPFLCFFPGVCGVCVFGLWLGGRSIVNCN